MSSNKKVLALFDFDGTLTNKDTFIEFIKFVHGTRKMVWGLLLKSPWLIGMKLKRYPNWKAKQKVLTHFFGGLSSNELMKLGQQFCTSQLPALLNKQALNKLDWHIKEKHTIYIISASASVWVAPWAQSRGLNLLATELAVETSSEKITGKIDGKNCYGPEKVKRLRTLEDLSKYNDIYAYGDSLGDNEMLAIANHAFYRCF